MVFKRPLTRSDGQVVKRILISNSCEGVGIALLALWRAMISLLGIALELEHYMSGLNIRVYLTLHHTLCLCRCQLVISL